MQAEFPCSRVIHSPGVSCNGSFDGGLLEFGLAMQMDEVFAVVYGRLSREQLIILSRRIENENPH